MEDTKQPLQDANNLVKTDITLLIIECRGWAGSLFRKMARNDGDIQFGYNRFVEIFYQLYLAFKHNAELSDRIKDWDKKKKVYDKLFYEKILKQNEVLPEIINYFDAFLSDVVKSGLYNLSETEIVERRV